MPTPIFAVVVEKGPPFSQQEFYLHTQREGAVIGAVRATMYAIRDKKAYQGPEVVEEFLLAAAREQWEEAFSLMTRVRKALAKHMFPVIEVKRMDSVDNGEIDEAAMKILARNLLSNFRSG
jgi:hypothetical protein